MTWLCDKQCFFYLFLYIMECIGSSVFSLQWGVIWRRSVSLDQVALFIFSSKLLLLLFSPMSQQHPHHRTVSWHVCSRGSSVFLQASEQGSRSYNADVLHEHSLPISQFSLLILSKLYLRKCAPSAWLGWTMKTEFPMCVCNSNPWCCEYVCLFGDGFSCGNKYGQHHVAFHFFLFCSI